MHTEVLCAQGKTPEPDLLTPSRPTPLQMQCYLLTCVQLFHCCVESSPTFCNDASDDQANNACFLGAGKVRRLRRLNSFRASSATQRLKVLLARMSQMPSITQALPIKQLITLVPAKCQRASTQTCISWFADEGTQPRTQVLYLWKKLSKNENRNIKTLIRPAMCDQSSWPWW